eukprot:g2295.t1
MEAKKEQEMEVKKNLEEQEKRKAAAKARRKARLKEKRDKEREAQRLLKLAESEELLRKLQQKFSVYSNSRDKKNDLIICAVDVEAWEFDGNKILEIGFASYSFLTKRFTCRHLVINEHLRLQNKKFVEGNKNFFLFGRSEVLSKKQASRAAAEELRKCDIVVGHAIKGDLDWLRSIGVDPDGKFIVDTQVLALKATPQAKTNSLKNLANEYKLNPIRLHNGANDAAFTLMVMLSQCNVSYTALQANAEFQELKPLDFGRGRGRSRGRGRGRKGFSFSNGRMGRGRSSRGRGRSRHNGRWQRGRK